MEVFEMSPTIYVGLNGEVGKIQEDGSLLWLKNEKKSPNPRLQSFSPLYLCYSRADPALGSSACQLHLLE